MVERVRKDQHIQFYVNQDQYDTLLEIASKYYKTNANDAARTIFLATIFKYNLEKEKKNEIVQASRAGDTDVAS